LLLRRLKTLEYVEMRKFVVLGAAMLSLPFAAAQAQDAAKDAKPAAEGAAAPSAAVADKVKADWAKYDTGNKGSLTKEELGKWLTDLRTAAGQPAPDAEWQATAFTQTDTNSDKKVSADELTTFLSSGS
jgi:hypothetical protein